MSSETPRIQTRSAEALALAEDTLAQLELGGSSLTLVVLRCLRLARLLEIDDAEQFFRLELRGYPRDGDWDAKYASWSGREAYETADRQLYWLQSIEEIEAELEIARAELETLRLMPTSITETSRGEAEQKLWMLPTPAQKMLTSVLKERSQRAGDLRRWTRIVACLRGTIQGWLSGLVVQLRYGTIVDTAFQRTKYRFDSFLLTHAPGVGRKLAAAYEGAESSDPERWSLALTSCRRALKVLADVVYPPTDNAPGEHDLSEERYKNRLIQFVSEHLDSESQEGLITAEIESVARRVDALNDLASKGVHSEVDRRDVELTVVHTYLLAGEILALLPEEEAVTLLTPPPVTGEEPPSNATMEEAADGDDTSGAGLPSARAQRDAEDNSEASHD